MNHMTMPMRNDKPGSAGAGAPRASSGRKQGEAFDLWLQRGLHQMFDDVANEPVPEDILRLIEEDRERTDPSDTGPES